MVEAFNEYLSKTNLSQNTKAAYITATKQYFSLFVKVDKCNLQSYKLYLLEKYKPKTVNLRIRAINCYLESIGQEQLKLSFIKLQQKTYIDNVISESDYEYFKECLKNEDEMLWYFVIRFMAATGG